MERERETERGLLRVQVQVEVVPGQHEHDGRRAQCQALVEKDVLWYLKKCFVQ